MSRNADVYNSRVTDEALEKRFRDTFRSQGGAELVDDLYAQGVIVPIVDFTNAATGQTLAQNLQTAWDFTTGYQTIANATTTLVTTAGFWQVDLNYSAAVDTVARNGLVKINDGTSDVIIWEINVQTSTNKTAVVAGENSFVVFLRSSDSLIGVTGSGLTLDIWYRQIATLNGDLVNPSGFTSS
jgi:hypothetical protein